MGSITIRTSGALALVLAVSTGAGCGSTTFHQVPDRSPAWTKVYVAGSRIPRVLDRQGKPDTGQYVITISGRELVQMPGVTLADKLNGSGF